MEAYEIEDCFDRKVLDKTYIVHNSGKNALGVEWSWSEVTGSVYRVSTGCRVENLFVPYELSKAKVIRDSVKAIAEISVNSQKHDSVHRDESPQFGKYRVRKDSSHTYFGQIDRIYVGTPDLGVVASIDFAEIRAEKARERMLLAEKRRIREENARKKVAPINEKLAEFGLSCDVPSSELYRAIDDALAQGQSSLVKLLQTCP